MGSSSSKVASKAAGAARRQYPSTSSIVNSATSNPHPTQTSSQSAAPSQVRPDPRAAPPNEEKSEHIELDGRDPQFGSALRKVGVAPPVLNNDAFPTSSQPMQPGQNIFPSTTNNPVLILVQARQNYSKQWELESEARGRPSFAGRTLLSAKDIREALTLRDEIGKTPQDVEKQMGLRSGILEQLVAKDVVTNG